MSSFILLLVLLSVIHLFLDNRNIAQVRVDCMLRIQLCACSSHATKFCFRGCVGGIRVYSHTAVIELATIRVDIFGAASWYTVVAADRCRPKA